MGRGALVQRLAEPAQSTSSQKHVRCSKKMRGRLTRRMGMDLLRGKGASMRRPSRVMIMRHLQEELWRMIEPQIESQGLTADSDQKMLRLAIQRFVEDKAKSLRIEQLADALDSPEQTLRLFLTYVRNKGIAGDPIAKS